jgi:hypothetical protein
VSLDEEEKQLLVIRHAGRIYDSGYISFTNTYSNIPKSFLTVSLCQGQCCNFKIRGTEKL